MAETAKDMVKKDLKKDKLKVPELDEKTKKHRDQMALLEIRAELEPYFIDNPLARLGFDVLERGEYLDGKGGGEILSYIVGNVDAGDSAYSTMGELIPSDKLDTEDRYPNKPLA